LQARTKVAEENLLLTQCLPCTCAGRLPSFGPPELARAPRLALLAALLALAAPRAGGRLIVVGAPSPSASATALPSAGSPAGPPADPARSHAALRSYARVPGALLPVPCREHLPELFAARGLLGDAAEVGVLRGDFSSLILKKWPGRRLFLVDPWVAQPDDLYVDINNGSNETHSRALRSTLGNVAPFAGRVEIVRDFSVPAAARFADGAFDWVYLDADHRYEAVRDDIAAWWPKVREKGGVLAGHDFIPDGDHSFGRFGVMRAVLEFAEREGAQVVVTYREPGGPQPRGSRFCETHAPSWMVLKGADAGLAAEAANAANASGTGSFAAGFGAGESAGEDLRAQLARGEAERALLRAQLAQLQVRNAQLEAAGAAAAMGR